MVKGKSSEQDALIPTVNRPSGLRHWAMGFRFLHAIPALDIYYLLGNLSKTFKFKLAQTYFCLPQLRPVPKVIPIQRPTG